MDILSVCNKYQFEEKTTNMVQYYSFFLPDACLLDLYSREKKENFHFLYENST